MKELRLKILVHLEKHARSSTSQYYVDDRALVAATGASLNDIRRALDILEEQGLTTSANAADSWCATISPRGSLHIEELVDQVGTAPSLASKPKIGF